MFSASNGVVLATEKKQKSILYDEQSVHKVEPITKHIGMVYSGMGPDYRWEIIICQNKTLGFFQSMQIIAVSLYNAHQDKYNVKTSFYSSVAIIICVLHDRVYSCLTQLKGCTAVNIVKKIGVFGSILLCVIYRARVRGSFFFYKCYPDIYR